MSNIRFTALEMAISRPRRNLDFISGKVSDYFGSLTFSRTAMEQFLTKETYHKVVAAIEKGEKLLAQSK